MKNMKRLLLISYEGEILYDEEVESGDFVERVTGTAMRTITLGKSEVRFNEEKCIVEISEREIDEFEE